MRRPAVVLALFLACCTAACNLRRQVTLPSPYCRGGNPLAGVYHPQRLRVKSRCRVAIGTVDKVKFEVFDGDVHVDLRPDPGYEVRLSTKERTELNEWLRDLEVIPRRDLPPKEPKKEFKDKQLEAALTYLREQIRTAQAGPKEKP